MMVFRLIPPCYFLAVHQAGGGSVPAPRSGAAAVRTSKELRDEPPHPGLEYLPFSVDNGKHVAMVTYSLRRPQKENAAWLQ